ncbi:hypothetical protein Barb6XT_00095 [Bacteroidales bacterium Barb6XT]|nr:hypothetical protein Barb6XT_00095 [Bacteroidales bacterium Barb6XT]
MAYITLQQAKAHLLVDESFGDDDQYITDLIDVAELVTERSICHPLKDYADEYCNLQKGLYQAILLLIGNFYSNREPVAFATARDVPKSFDFLIDLWRDWEG